MKKRIAVSALLFTFAFPALAGATLVINSGMSGVSLGDTMKQVRQKLGRPNEVDHSGGTTAWFYTFRTLVVDFSRQSRVHDISTLSGSQRTASGVGVGSTETAVMKFVPGVHCSGNAQGPQGTDCVAASGHVFTDFHVTSQRGLVKYVLISRRP
jgi:hypothetical protein